MPLTQSRSQNLHTGLQGPKALLPIPALSLPPAAFSLVLTVLVTRASLLFWNLPGTPSLKAFALAVTSARKSPPLDRHVGKHSPHVLQDGLQQPTQSELPAPRAPSLPSQLCFVRGPHDRLTCYFCFKLIYLFIVCLSLLGLIPMRASF